MGHWISPKPNSRPMNPVRYIVELEQPSEDTGIFDSREKNGMEMDGSGTSSRNYRGNALYNGECSISYSQSSAWPGNLLCTCFNFDFSSLLCSMDPLSLSFDQRSLYVVRFFFFFLFCSRSTLVMICGTLPWNAGTRNSWRISPPLLIDNFLDLHLLVHVYTLLLLFFLFLKILSLGVWSSSDNPLS